VFISNTKSFKSDISGVFDAQELSYDGSSIPTQLDCIPPLKKSENLEERELYCLTKVEEVDCPNCCLHYDKINRFDLRPNVQLMAILELMKKLDEDDMQRNSESNCE
jgi:hypothetical protein